MFFSLGFNLCISQLGSERAGVMNIKGPQWRKKEVYYSFERFISFGNVFKIQIYYNAIRCTSALYYRNIEDGYGTCWFAYIRVVMQSVGSGVGKSFPSVKCILLSVCIV